MFIENRKIRWLILLFIFLTSLILVLPNFTSLPQNWPFSLKKLNYGLDIQGGLHLLIAVDTKSVLREKTLRMLKSLEVELSDKSISFKKAYTLNKKTHSEMVFQTKNPIDQGKIEAHLKKNYGVELQLVEKRNNLLFYRFYEVRLKNMNKDVISQSIEVLRNRIDEFGVAEPSITSQGDKRIVVQLPGIKDAQRAKELIYKTARLYLRALHTKFPTDKLQRLISEVEKKNSYSLGKLNYSKYIKRLNEDLKNKIPENTSIVFEKMPGALSMEAGKTPYLVSLVNEIGGDLLDDAQVGQDEYGRPQVNFSFSPQGRKLFSELTGQNVGGQVAIILDDVLKSAPMIREKIDSQGARIQLGSGDYDSLFNEAKLIATALRAGALPASLEALEERTVGPSLGKKAIERGKKAGLVGFILVFIFMLFYYRKLGVIADLSLSMSLLMLLGVLTSLGATLTLPGVAGIVLTLGMAVDANVIIFERIKEELKKGLSIENAVRNGFSYAFSAIFDANITTIAVCVVLMNFGSGPVRGFAITLICGVLISMLSSIFFSRSLIDFGIYRLRIKKWL